MSDEIIPRMFLADPSRAPLNGGPDVVAPDNMIDASARFRADGMRYRVTVRVRVSFSFLLAALQCLFLRKALQIEHTFPQNPFLNQEFEAIEEVAPVCDDDAPTAAPPGVSP